MIFTVVKEVIPKAATVISVFMTVYTIPCPDRGYINIMMVLQSCSNSLHILTGPSSETNATSSDCAYHVGNVKVEDDLDMQEEGEVNVKTEKDIGNEEEESIGIKDEEGMYSEEEEEDVDIKEEDVDIKEEDVDIKEEDIDIKEEDVDIKEEVSVQDTV